MILLTLAGCSVSRVAPDDTIYRDLTSGKSELDRSAAQDMVNAYRQMHHVQPVKLEERLTDLAQQRANALATSIIDGESPPREEELRNALRAAGYHAGEVGEITGLGYPTIADAFTAWRHSPRDNDIMLMASVREMGVAAVHVPGSANEVYWVMLLARPI